MLELENVSQQKTNAMNLFEIRTIFWQFPQIGEIACLYCKPRFNN